MIPFPTAPSQADDDSLRHLLWGLPSVLSLLAMAGLLVAVALLDSEQLIDTYQDTARQRYREGDYVGAQECYRRLAQLQANEHDVRYGLALTDYELGHRDRAIKVMSRLAHPEQAGFAPAHLWWARRYLVASQETRSLSALEAAELHLRRAIESQPADGDAHALLGQLCLATGRYAEAEQHLTVGVTSHPELGLALARAYRSNNKDELATKVARSAMSYYYPRLETRPNDHTARKELAELAIFLGDFPTATALLSEGLGVTATAGYQQALAAAYAAWCEQMARDSTAATDLYLERLLLGLRYDPTSEQLLQHLVTLARRDDGWARKTRQALEAQQSQGQPTPALSVLLAVEAHRQGHMAEAREKYEAAYKVAPHVSLVANNLAWLLAHEPPTDLPRALAVVEEALRLSPGNIEYLDTRGHIFAKLEKWPEARADLEAAAQAHPGDKKRHQLLADVYEHLQLPDLAAQQRKLAQP